MPEFLAWKPHPSQYFGTPEASCEQLRRPWPDDAPDELVETSYFGFSIPDEDIHCEIYHWAHPKFGLTSGGIMIFRGIKQHQMNADYVNYINYQPLPDDITDCTYADGVTVRMTKPLQEFEISYEDADAETSVRFTATAIMPPAVRPTGGHITQPMKTTGTLILRGERYEIDSYFTRDRSWGDPRSEGKLDIPTIGWHVAVFGDDLAFHTTAFETTEHDPALVERYPGFEGKNHIWGYVWKDDTLLGVKSTRRRVCREADCVTPARIELELTDEHDTVHRLNGTITARLPMCVWPNMTFFFALTRWELEGEERLGWGDTQEGLYEHFVRENYRS